MSLRTPDSYEANRLPELPDEANLNAAVRDLMTAVNGFPYAGAEASALVRAVRWLRANPGHAAALGIGGPKWPR